MSLIVRVGDRFRRQERESEGVYERIENGRDKFGPYNAMHVASGRLVWVDPEKMIRISQKDR